MSKEDLYALPLNIRVCDKRAFGRQPMVGTHVIGSLKSYYTDPTPEKIVVVESFGGVSSCHYWLCVLCVYCMHINYPIVTSAAQETAAHPDASQVEAQKQLEQERLDVC